MKRWIGTGLSVLLLVGMLAGCELPLGSSEVEESSAVSSALVSEPEQAEPAHMGLLQSVDTPMENELREAFLSRLEEWGYDESRLTVDYQSTDGNVADDRKFCEQFEEDNAQVVVVLSKDTLPIVEETLKKDTEIISIGDQVQLKSGVQQTLALALQIDPNMKAIGLLDDGFNSEAKKEVEVYCEAHEIELVVVQYVDETPGSVAQAMDQLSGKVSAFYTLPGAVTESQAEEFATAAKDRALAWYASDSFLVQQGAFAAVTPDLTKAGYELADRMIAALLGQEQDEPVTFEATCTSFNQQTMSVLGLSVPDEILETAAIETETVN